MQSRFAWPLLGLVVAILVLGLDQLAKHLILRGSAPSDLGPLDQLITIRLTENRGISFGIFDSLGQWGPRLLSIAAVVIIAALLAALSRTRSRWSAIGMGMIIGGALGNLLDRVRLGSVVDFLDLHFGTWHPFVFNGADAAITVGVCFLLLDGLLTSSESHK
jgi:signal peptidase II